MFFNNDCINFVLFECYNMICTFYSRFAVTVASLKEVK